MREASVVDGTIPLPNYRHDVFLALLEYLYTDKVCDCSRGPDLTPAE